VGLLAGLLNGIWYPAFAGLMPILVPQEKLQSANAATGFGSNVAFMLGTASGGVVVAVWGVGWALAVDAITFLIAGALVYPLSKLHQKGQAQDGEKGNFIGELKLGWHEFRSRSWLVTIVIAFAILNMSFEAVWAVLGALQSLDKYSGAATWGLVLGFMSLGFLLGTIIANKARPKHPLRMVMILMLADPLFLFTFGTAQPLIVLLVSAVAVGIAMDIFYVVWATTIQQNVPAESLSRVNSYDSFGSFVFGPIGIMIAGPLAVAIGIQNTLLIGAGFSILAVVGALLVPGVRNLEAKFND
jgi:predicted MFS family arabinose efflux permease